MLAIGRAWGVGRGPGETRQCPLHHAARCPSKQFCRHSTAVFLGDLVAGVAAVMVCQAAACWLQEASMCE